MNVKDDINMIPDWSMNQIMEDERSVKSVIKLKKEFEAREPEASEWIELLITSDINKLKNSFGRIFNENNKLEKALSFICWKSILRGLQMGDAKWKSNFLLLPGESKIRNPKHYIPSEEDFE